MLTYLLPPISTSGHLHDHITTINEAMADLWNAPQDPSLPRPFLYYGKDLYEAEYPREHNSATSEEILQSIEDTTPAEKRDILQALVDSKLKITGCYRNDDLKAAFKCGENQPREIALKRLEVQHAEKKEP